MPSQLDICNQALAEIFSASIASMDERSVEAQACSRFYDSSLQEMLEGHPWSFANKRVTLAAIANDRPLEWAFAYSLPTDCAKPLRIVPSDQMISPPADFAYYGIWGEWQRRGLPWDYGFGRLYDVEAGKLYGWIDGAILEYVSRDAALSSASALFARALSLDLASKIVSPLKKSRDLKGDLIKQAEVAKQRAIAEDRNRQPQQDAPYESDALLARRGYGESGCGVSY